MQNVLFVDVPALTLSWAFAFCSWTNINKICGIYFRALDHLFARWDFCVVIFSITVPPTFFRKYQQDRRISNADHWTSDSEIGQKRSWGPTSRRDDLGGHRNTHDPGIFFLHALATDHFVFMKSTVFVIVIVFVRHHSFEKANASPRCSLFIFFTSVGIWYVFLCFRYFFGICQKMTFFSGNYEKT